jgi:hypothetical protein
MNEGRMGFIETLLYTRNCNANSRITHNNAMGVFCSCMIVWPSEEDGPCGSEAKRGGASK